MNYAKITIDKNDLIEFQSSQIEITEVEVDRLSGSAEEIDLIIKLTTGAIKLISAYYALKKAVGDKSILINGKRYDLSEKKEEEIEKVLKQFENK